MYILDDKATVIEYINKKSKLVTRACRVSEDGNQVTMSAIFNVKPDFQISALGFFAVGQFAKQKKKPSLTLFDLT